MSTAPQPSDAARRQLGNQVPGRVALLVIPDCPNSAEAAATLSDALVRVGRPGMSFRTIVVDSLQAAKVHGFTGSPSVHVDGRDVLPVPGATPAVACRMYVHANGSRHGVPETSALARALHTMLHEPPSTPPGAPPRRQATGPKSNEPSD